MKIIFWNNLFTLLALVGYAGLTKKCPTSKDFKLTQSVVEAVVNKDTVLPCLPKFNINVENDDVEWSNGTSVDIYKFREGKSTIHVDYKDRLSIPIEELKEGKASLIFLNVTSSDKGKYCCCITQGDVTKCTTLTLDVVSEDVKPKPPPKEEGRQDQPVSNEVKPPPEDIYGFWKTTEGYITIGGIVGAVLLIVAAGVGIYRCCKQPQTQPKRKDLSINKTEMRHLNTPGASDVDAKPTTSKNPARQTKPRNSPKKSSRQKNRRS